MSRNGTFLPGLSVCECQEDVSSYMSMHVCPSVCKCACTHVCLQVETRGWKQRPLNYCPPLFLRKGLSLKVGLADLVKMSKTSWTAFFPSLLNTGIRTSRRHSQLFSWVLENKLRSSHSRGSTVITAPSCQLHIKFLGIIIGFPLYGQI